MNENKKIEVVLADRGRGVFETLRSVDVDLRNDEEALEVAFTQKISGRAPENRGNGLKFVRRSVTDMGLLLNFFSGDAKLSLNGGMTVEKVETLTKGCFVIVKG